MGPGEGGGEDEDIDCTCTCWTRRCRVGVENWKRGVLWFCGRKKKANTVAAPSPSSTFGGFRAENGQKEEIYANMTAGT